MKKKRLWLSILLAVLMVVLIPAGTAAAEEEKDKDVSNPDFNVTVETFSCAEYRILSLSFTSSTRRNVALEIFGISMDAVLAPEAVLFPLK